MRVVIYIAQFCFLLLFGRGYTTHISPLFDKTVPLKTEHVSKHHPLKFSNKHKGTLLIEDNEVELDEEFHSSDTKKNKLKEKLFSHNNFLNDKYQNLSYKVVLNNYDKHTKNFSPLSGYSKPIYILQRVLRI